MDMPSSAVWMMFALWMFSGNHYIVGSISIVFSIISSLDR